MKDTLEFNVKFIELIQERPCLYDFNRSEYNNRNSQDAAWNEIAKKLNESVYDCKERWKNLRGCYTRHLKNNSKPSSVKRVKPYYLAEQLQFLNSFTKPRTPKGFYKLEEQDEEQEHDNTNETDEETEHFVYYNTPTLSLSANERVTHSQNNESFQICDKIIKQNKYNSMKNVNSIALSNLESRLVSPEEKQDPDLAFLYSLLPDVKDMTREQKIKFKIGVLQLISNIAESSFASPTSDGSSSSNTPVQ